MQKHTNTTALVLDKVTVRHGNALALESLSMAVNRGDQIAIIGPNGAGKSTLFNVITGLVKPTSGEVNIYGSEPDEHICIGYVPQRSQIDWRFPVTVFDVVMMGRVGQIGLFRWASQQDQRLVMDALHAVEMADLAKRQIGELSGGQQQRVFLARALAQETQLLLLDEPLAGLDIPSQEAILKILTELQRRGITMLVSLHDISQAAEYFRQILLLNRHQIAYGPSAHVLTHENLAMAYGKRWPLVAHLHNGLPDGLPDRLPDGQRIAGVANGKPV